MCLVNHKYISIFIQKYLSYRKVLTEFLEAYSQVKSSEFYIKERVALIVYIPVFLLIGFDFGQIWISKIGISSSCLKKITLNHKYISTSESDNFYMKEGVALMVCILVVILMGLTVLI